MTAPALVVRDLSVSVGGSRVVDGVDLEVAAGETFALLGESGCGKSMTALALMRLLPPGGRVRSGSVRLDGEELLDLPEYAMRGVRGGRLGMIFQEPQTSLNPVLRVGDQIAEAARLHDPAADPRRRAVELLAAVGIPDPERRVREFPHQLSGGMKQRVMIAMALAGRPRLLIADEPTTALDVTIQAQVLDLLADLRRETGMAMMLITHDLGVVAESAGRLAIMYAGQILESAPVGAFFAAPAHPYGRMLLAALPTGERRGGHLAAIEGRVPSPDEALQGCRFAPRCPQAEARCHRQPPDWHPVGPGHRVRCHLWAQGGHGAHVDVPVAKGPGAEEGAAAPLLETQGLQVHFPIRKGLLKRVVGRVRAVDGIDLHLDAGRTLALVGESGCGKTTYGKALLQLIRPTGGRVLYRGRDLAALSGRALRPFRRELQIVFQDPFAAMNPRMLVGDIVAEGLVAQGLAKDRAERRARVAELLERVGIAPEAAARYPHEFSGGQRQRICIARALAVEPRLIVCDEPTSALDVSVQAQILNLLHDLQTGLGLAYLFITHDISVVAYLAHEVAVMYLGRIVERGRVEAVLAAPLHPYTRALLSAVPEPDPASRRQRIHLEGDMPSPADPPGGCHFHPRCPEADARCAREYPPLRTLSSGRVVACHHVPDG